MLSRSHMGFVNVFEQRGHSGQMATTIEWGGATWLCCTTEVGKGTNPHAFWQNASQCHTAFLLLTTLNLTRSLPTLLYAPLRHGLFFGLSGLDNFLNSIL